MFAILPAFMPRWRHTILVLGLFLAFSLTSRISAAEEPLRLKVVGGLADVSQYVRFEEPFWRKRISELTNGRVVGEIAPVDRAGFRAEEMLQLMRLGVVPFGTASLVGVTTEAPALTASHLPAFTPDLASLRQTVRLYRPHLKQILQERYGIELLAVYTYPAQVTWCRRPFNGLGDLAGRRVRTSSVGQTEMFEALGATPVVIPFAGVVQAMKAGVVECAVTGTLSGLAVGLQEVTTHVHSMALTWGVSVFGVNQEAWRALPQDTRDTIRKGVAELEDNIWDSVARETGDGLDCSAGKSSCANGPRGNLTIVPVTPADDSRRRSLLVQTVLPRWVDRCGPDCADAWNRYLGPTLGIPAYAH
jgi:TRAP-type C4-dicarboxylate transport system substrate-binding protein